MAVFTSNKLDMKNCRFFFFCKGERLDGAKPSFAKGSVRENDRKLLSSHVYLLSSNLNGLL